MPISKRNLRRCLIRKFGFVEGESTRHEKYSLYIDEKIVAITYTSRSHDEIDDSILAEMAKQIGVRLNDLKSMCSCQISKKKYLGMLQQSGRLS